MNPSALCPAPSVLLKNSLLTRLCSKCRSINSSEETFAAAMSPNNPPRAPPTVIAWSLDIVADSFATSPDGDELVAPVSPLTTKTFSLAITKLEEALWFSAAIFIGRIPRRNKFTSNVFLISSLSRNGWMVRIRPSISKRCGGSGAFAVCAGVVWQPGAKITNPPKSKTSLMSFIGFILRFINAENDILNFDVLRVRLSA